MGAADRNPRPRPPPSVTVAIGIDVGGTKIAAGVVDTASGAVLERRRCRRGPERGGEAVLADCAALAAELGGGRLPVGIGLCELVDLDGRPASGDTVDWRGLDVAAAVGGAVASSSSPTSARPRSRRPASARAPGVSPFLFVVVGTGASACLVVDGRPYAGAHGEAIVLGAPPVESRRAGLRSPAPPGSSAPRTSWRTRRTRRSSTTRPAPSAACSPSLANALDPSLVVLGGGLGTAPRLPGTRRAGVPGARRVPARPAAPGRRLARSAPDGGVVGAALLAADVPG